jgi:hypothetical protein
MKVERCWNEVRRFIMYVVVVKLAICKLMQKTRGILYEVG